MVPASRCPPLRAEVAELADAQASGACGRKVVEVQILSSAPTVARSAKVERDHQLTAVTTYAVAVRRLKRIQASSTIIRNLEQRRPDLGSPRRRMEEARCESCKVWSAWLSDWR